MYFSNYTIIKQAVKAIEDVSTGDIAIMHCVLAYPTGISLP